MQLVILVLFPLAFLLPPGAQAGLIIGGWEARPHSRPYMAYLQMATWNGVKTCGGFLIRDDMVLTAAHCNDACGDAHVSLGVHDLRLREWSRQDVPVRRRIPHPRFDRGTLNNDIMLLQLARRARLTRWVQPIALPRAGQRLWPGAVCSVAGWGRTSPRRALGSPTLQEAAVAVLEDAKCRRSLVLVHHYYNTSTMMCAGNPEQGKNCFKGDSGGPLVCGQTAHGIVSWGSPNGTPPGVYTRVSWFIPWIRETMRKLQA